MGPALVLAKLKTAAKKARRLSRDERVAIAFGKREFHSLRAVVLQC